MGIKIPEGFVARNLETTEPKRESIKELDALRNIIKREEGLKLIPYKDNQGVLTVGYGLNLAQEKAVAELKKVGIDKDELISGKTQLTSDQAEALMNINIEHSLEIARSIFPKFNSFGAGRQHAVIDMIYNLGEDRFKKFDNTINFIRRGKWDRAAKEILLNSRRDGPSKYMKQVPNRATRNSDRLLRGL